MQQTALHFNPNHIHPCWVDSTRRTSSCVIFRPWMTQISLVAFPYYLANSWIAKTAITIILVASEERGVVGAYPSVDSVYSLIHSNYLVFRPRILLGMAIYVRSISNLHWIMRWLVLLLCCRMLIFYAVAFPLGRCFVHISLTNFYGSCPYSSMRHWKDKS